LTAHKKIEDFFQKLYLCERSSCKWGEREKGNGRKGKEKTGNPSSVLSPLRTYYMVFIIFNLVHFIVIFNG